MRNIKKIVSRLFLVFVVLLLFEALVEFLYRPSQTYTIYSIRELKESQGKIDTLFLGTSTAYRGFSPEVFDEEMGTYSFNLATASQPLSGTLALLKDQVEKNPVKQVIIGISPSSLKKKTVSKEAEAEVYDRLISPFEKITYLLGRCPSDDWLYLNFYSVRVNKYFKLGKIKENVTYKLSDAYQKNIWPMTTYQGRGFLMKDKIYSGEAYDVLAQENATWKADEKNEEDLIEIIKYCKEKNIRLTLVFIPVSGSEIKRYKDVGTIHDYLYNLAKDNETVFWDFNYYVGLKEEFPNQMFFDQRHLNGTGGIYFSRLFTEVYKKYVQGEKVEQYFMDVCPYYENKD